MVKQQQLLLSFKRFILARQTVGSQQGADDMALILMLDLILKTEHESGEEQIAQGRRYLTFLPLSLSVCKIWYFIAARCANLPSKYQPSFQPNALKSADKKKYLLPVPRIPQQVEPFAFTLTPPSYYTAQWPCNRRSELRHLDDTAT